jgi:hypothetical protein
MTGTRTGLVLTTEPNIGLAIRLGISPKWEKKSNRIKPNQTESRLIGEEKLIVDGSWLIDRSR